MTHDDAFLQAIIEAPDDEGLRLIYADYLEEQGDPRGELIRLQCALAHLPVDDGQRPALETLVQRLVVQHGDPLIAVPQEVRLVESGWGKRVLKLTGRVRATVEYNGRRIGYDLVRVDGRVVERQIQADMGPHRFVIRLPGLLGLVPATLDARCNYWLSWLRIRLAGRVVYEEGSRISRLNPELFGPRWP